MLTRRLNRALLTLAALLLTCLAFSEARAENDTVYNRTYQAVRVKITHETRSISWLSTIAAGDSDLAPLDPGPRHMVVFRKGSNDILATRDFMAERDGLRNITIRQTINGTFWIDLGSWQP